MNISVVSIVVDPPLSCIANGLVHTVTESDIRSRENVVHCCYFKQKKQTP